MIYFLFGFCFCITLDKIIEWVRLYTSDHRNNRRNYIVGYKPIYYPDYRNQNESTHTLAINNIRGRLNDLEDQWYEFKEKYPDMFEQDEESEEEV